MPRRAVDAHRRGQSSVFDDIAVAHGEIYALYQIAQTMGTSLGVSDTMALIASKLTSLVPFSACTLFLYDESTNLLTCRFATGTDYELMQQLTLKSGQGHHGLGGAQPAAARQRATERRSRSRWLRAANDAAVGAGLPAGVRGPRHRHAGGVPHDAELLSATIIAGCSTACASRPRP